SLAAGAYIVSAQQPDDEVRGAFIESRPKTTNLNSPSRRHRRRPVNTNANASAASTPTINANTANANTASNRSRPSGTKQQTGLGYTLFMRDADGRGVRVEPSREFHHADRARLAPAP